jgi:hypothetical protein
MGRRSNYTKRALTKWFFLVYQRRTILATATLMRGTRPLAARQAIFVFKSRRGAAAKAMTALELGHVAATEEGVGRTLAVENPGV